MDLSRLTMRNQDREILKQKKKQKKSPNDHSGAVYISAEAFSPNTCRHVSLFRTGSNPFMLG